MLRVLQRYTPAEQRYATRAATLRARGATLRDTRSNAPDPRSNATGHAQQRYTTGVATLRDRAATLHPVLNPALLAGGVDSVGREGALQSAAPRSARVSLEFANDVVFTGQNLLSGSSVQGLQVYRLAQHVVKQPDGADLQPFVDTMSHIVKKTMNIRKKPAAPAPTPSTPTPSHTPFPPGAQGFLASIPVPDKTPGMID